MSHIILGANGHIGSVLATELLQRSEDVTVVVRDEKKAPDWKQKGAKVAVADVRDVETLRGVFREGRRLFLLNPPADPSTDTDLEERKSLFSILAALDGSGLEKVVAESTYGAQLGERIGDLGVLYEMEQALAAQSIAHSIIRGAYYMSNWDGFLESAREGGEISTFYPVDFKLPMVAPSDIGKFAAGLMVEPVEGNGRHAIEGPEYYSGSDVAEAFSAALNKPVKVVQIPQEHWIETMKGMGFSDEAAESFAAMTESTLNAKFPIEENPVKGATSLREYIGQLVEKGK